MTGQKLIAEFSTTLAVNEKVCKCCRFLIKKEEEFYCKKLQAFLADQMLSQQCDLLEVQK